MGLKLLCRDKLPVEESQETASQSRDLKAMIVLALCLCAQFPARTFAMSCEEALLGQARRIRPSQVLRQYPASETASQIVRDNAPFYWAELRVNSPLKGNELPAILLSQVISVGDLHSGNFSPLLVQRRKVIYTLFDIKDLGYAPALYDLNRLVLNTLAVAAAGGRLSAKERGRIADEIYTAYHIGLGHERFRLTSQYRLDLPTVAQFERDLAKKQEKKVGPDGLLKVDRKSTFPLSFAEYHLQMPVAKIREKLEAELRLKLGWGHLRDAVVNIRDRGGSREQIRILALFETQDGKILLKELKRNGASAISTFQDQPSLLDVHTAASGFLDYDINSVFPRIQIGESTFVLRDKKVESISVAYKQESKSDYKELLQLARAHAQWTGTFHGRQLLAQMPEGNRRFAEAVRDHQPLIIELFDDFNLRHAERLNGRR